MPAKKTKKTRKAPVKKRRKGAGRPTKFTAQTLAKLDEAFAIGCSDREACVFADVDPRNLYRYQEKHPEFRQRKELLKEKPILLARWELVKGLKNNPELCMKFLERKLRKEFGPKQELEHTGSVEVAHQVREELLAKLKNVIPGDDT